MQSQKNQFKGWFQVALVNLFLASLLGVVLRLGFIVELPGLSFKNILHGHSHMAMIGWGYQAVFAILMQYFGRDYMHQRVFRLLYLGNQVAVVGMFLTFPIFGYTGIPIFFTTVHLFLTYIFAYYFLKQFSKFNQPGIANNFVKAAFIFHIISTLAIWVLPFLIANDLRHSAAYHMAVQFFLHFQFNGWFIFALLGIFFKLIEPQIILARKVDLKLFFALLCVATVLTYAMAVTWSEPIPMIFLINSIGVVIQLVALLFFIRILRGLPLLAVSNPAGTLLRFALLCFTLKILMQSCVVVPHMAIVSYTIRNFVIGFIHLILLGTLTCSILAIALELQWIKYQFFKVKLGLSIFILGFLLTEILLFYQGTLLWAKQGFLPSYYLVLFLLSLLFPIGFFFLVAARQQSSKQPFTNPATLEKS